MKCKINIFCYREEVVHQNVATIKYKSLIIASVLSYLNQILSVDLFILSTISLHLNLQIMME